MKINNKHIKRIQVGYTGLNSVDIPVLEIGSGQPCTTIICGMHGNEYSSLHVVEKLLRELDSHNVIGKLRIILGANAWGQSLRVRETPQDVLDLNRVYPGDAKAEISKRVANKIYKMCLDSNAVIDLHTFEDPSPIMAIYLNCGSDEVKKKSLELVKTFKPAVVWKLNYSSSDEVRMSGALGAVLANDGISSYAVEMPEEHLITDDEINKVAKGLERTLIHCGIIAGKNSNSNELTLLDRETVRSDISGLYTSKVSLLKEIQEGEVIGKIVSLPDMRVHKVLSPHKGLMLINKSRGFVSTGDRLFCVGTNIKKE